MPQEVLGTHTFLEVPTVNGVPVLLSAPGGGSVLTAYTGTVARTTGTTLIPFDNTTPLSTEGTQLWTQTLTPKSTSSRFLCNYTLDVGTSASRIITIALFRGTTCLTSRSVYTTNTYQPAPLTLRWVDLPATTAAITYSLRIGISTAGTWTVNGTTAANMGGANAGAWSIIELS